MVDYSDEEITQWVETFKREDNRYTTIPDHYYNDIDNWFSPSTIQRDFDGDVRKACSVHPVYFAFYYLGYRLRNYQIYMMDMLLKEKYVQGIWGRRMGKSLVYKTFILWAIHYNKFPQGLDKSTKVLVLAHTSDSAESYIAEIKDFMEWGDKRVYRLFKGKMGDKYFSSNLPNKGNKKGKKDTNEIIHYMNVEGSWCSVEVYPPTTRARGRPASVIIMDEMAFWSDYTPDEKMIYNKVVKPIATDQPDVKLFIATTPNGEKGISYDLMDIDGHDTRYKLMWFPFYYRDELEYWRIIKDEEDDYQNQNDYDGFRQEFLADIVSAQGAYFDKEKEVDKVFDQIETLNMMNRYTGVCRVAIDFGGSKNSHTTIMVAIPHKYIDDNGAQVDGVRAIYHKRYPIGQDSMLQGDCIKLSQNFPNIEKWYIDSQGGGSSFYGWFKDRFVYEEVSFKKEKVDMYRQFKIACFQGRVKSYYNPILLKEFNGFTGDLKPSKGYTDDLLDAFVMSVKEWVVVNDNTPYSAMALRRGYNQQKIDGWRPSVRTK